MINPDLKRFKELAGQGNLIPVCRTIGMDLDTPVSLFAKLCKDEKYAFLLESLEGGERWGRYSFLGLDPFIVFSSSGQEVRIERDGRVHHIHTSNPLETLRGLMGDFRPAGTSGLPRFYGGAVGYLGYDMVRFMERLPRLLEDRTGFSDSALMFPRLVLVYDNLKQTLTIIVNLLIDDGSSLESVYREGVGSIDEMIQRIGRGLDYQVIPAKAKVTTQLEPEIVQGDFEDMVGKAKEYIKAGDIIQVVLSQRFSGRNHIPTFDLYRSLRRINPSPYLYYLKMADETIVGSSPEILVRLTAETIEVRPIAGTRPRGRDDAEDRRLEQELLADPKERAEHLMLVDLGRNDVGRVAELGSVRVEDLMTIERYSHVMHIVSGVKGRLARGRDMFDVLRACFPAGTVSGAPKIRAMEIIEELEHFRRGPYAGAVGYFGFSGNMDLAITIRTLCQKADMLYLQAGAGIVADSDPAREWEETINKGKALMRALKAAEGMD